MVNENNNKKNEVKTPGKPKKERNQGPPTKIMIRKLPPTFTEEEFKTAISSIPENNYFKFVPADKSFGPHAFSRVYINFVNIDEIYSFRDRFDGYVFVDQKGNEYPALVEYASFQKIPKPSHQKKDIRCGTIDEDPDYVAFLDLLENPETVNLPQIETLLEEIEKHEKETRANNGHIKIKTPLLEYIEQRSADRFRLGDKKRRKEYDRKKAREEERRKRKEIIKEYRKRDDHYSREERERDRTKKREEERLKWKEKKQEKEKNVKRDKNERYKVEDRSSKGKEPSFSSESKKRLDDVADEECRGSSKTPSFGDEKPKGVVGASIPQKTKRYSEVRKKEEREKRSKEERSKGPPSSEAMEEEEEEDDPRDADEGVKAASTKGEKEDMKEQLHKTPPSTDEGETTPVMDEEEAKEDECEGEQPDDFQASKERAEDSEEKSGGKDPRAERRIRNKDRPAMQLYRPGQSRLKSTRPKSSAADEVGSMDRANDGAESSSSSASPVMGLAGSNEGNELPQPVPPPSESGEGDKKENGAGEKTYLSDRGYERKATPSKCREPRAGTIYCEGEGRGSATTKMGGARKGYSYNHERESKSKWSAKGSKDAEVAAGGSSSGSQFKSLTFRRSTSQE